MRKTRQLDLFDDFLLTPERESCESLPCTESGLLALAVALGAREVSGWTEAEERLCQSLHPVSSCVVRHFRDHIRAERDPLGDVFCRLRSPAERRQRGATFTPSTIVSAMVDWASSAPVARIVEPGMGSGRFSLSAAKRFPCASILGIELDPIPAILARANLAVCGLAPRSKVMLADYRYFDLPPIQGRTLFIGNPPYVRHHQLDAMGKQWLVDEARKQGLSASQLAGLHVYFFLATLKKAAPGDLGVFITSAEWLDVNYGSLVRELFLGPLGGKQLFIVEPQAVPFPDADTTAAVTAFEIGSKPKSIRLRRVQAAAELSNSNGGRLVRRERLESERRWSHLTRAGRKPPSGYIELGEVCRVHRGQVTGANKIWIEGPHCQGLPESVFFHTVTKARELFSAGPVLTDSSKLRRVVDLPVDLAVFDRAELSAIERFLAMARKQGVHEMYIASNRRAWWSVGLRKPAPILATYMARRPPAFVRNLAAARHLNIAHGLYPREPLSTTLIEKLIAYLCRFTDVSSGRTYSGGLTKFEPREMERIFIPSPEMLVAGDFHDPAATLDA